MSEPGCPRCGGMILVWASCTLRVITAPGGSSDIGIAEPWGTSFPISGGAPATCNRHGCGWEGPARNIQGWGE